MDRYYNQQYVYIRDANDVFLTSFTALFIASKNSEVEPLSLRDIRTHFLFNRFSNKDILLRETEMRVASVYENEVTTLFDYVMIYLKVWKMGC